MISDFKLLLSLFFIIVLSPVISLADWINLTGSENSRNIAEIYVEEDQVRVNLELFVGDLTVFEELIPDIFFSEPISDRPGVEQRMQKFADETMQIITDSGEKLSAVLRLVEPRIRVKRPSPFVGKINPYTRLPIPGPPDDKRVLYVEVSYRFKERPSTLTFIPPVDKNGFPKVSIGFICYHQGVPVVDFRQLTERNVLHLEWDDPWYSAFEKKQLKRTLQSGMRTFLYIEPYEVRHEILVRVKDMMNWMEFNLRDDRFIDEDEFDPVRRQVANFFMEREKVLIDGRRLPPILDRTAYVESSIMRSRFIEIPERVPLNTAMIGIVITYLTEGIPREVETSWDLFSDRIQKVTGRMTDPAGPFPYDLTPGDNVLKWTNYLQQYTIPTVTTIKVADNHRGMVVPLLSLVCSVMLVPVGVSCIVRHRNRKSIQEHVSILAILCVGTVAFIPYLKVSSGGSTRASQVSQDDSKAIVHSLLKNVYRAFDFRAEEDVYDKLAISISGELLTDIYLQNRRSMVIEQAGGAQAKVTQVEIIDTNTKRSKKENCDLDIRTKWTATGSVGHWGHIHTRQNYYDAILSLTVDNGNWKIAGIELLEEKRLDPLSATPRRM